MPDTFQVSTPNDTDLVLTRLFDALATTELTEQGAGTLLTCTVSYPSRAVRDAVVASGLIREDAAAYNRLAVLLRQ